MPSNHAPARRVAPPRLAFTTSAPAHYTRKHIAVNNQSFPAITYHARDTHKTARQILRAMEAPLPIALASPQKRPHTDDVEPSTPNRNAPSNASTPLTVISSLDSPSPSKPMKRVEASPSDGKNAPPNGAPTSTQPASASGSTQQPAKRRKLTQKEKEEQAKEKEAKAQARAEKKAQEEKSRTEQKVQKEEERRIKDEEKRKKNEEKEEKKRAKELKQQQEEEEKRKKERVSTKRRMK